MRTIGDIRYSRGEKKVQRRIILFSRRDRGQKLDYHFSISAGIRIKRKAAKKSTTTIIATSQPASKRPTEQTKFSKTAYNIQEAKQSHGVLPDRYPPH